MSILGRRRPARTPGPPVDLTTTIGSVELLNPVLTASGTAGHGDELAAYVDLSRIGAVVVKSLSPEPWAGNPAPRVHETPAGMINSVGLQGPGVARWLDDELPAVLATGARVVASIWGRSVDDYRRAAEMLADAPAGVVAVEVNVSCPNLEDRNRMFAHSADSTAEAVAATSGVRSAAVGQAQPERERPRRHRRCRPRRRGRGGDAGQHRSGHGHRPRDRVDPAWVAEGAACPGRPSIPSRCGRSTTCTPLSPTCPSSGWEVWPGVSMPSS